MVSRGQSVSLTTQEAFWLATGLPLLETTTYPEPGSSISWQLNLARTLGGLIPPYAFFLLLIVLVGDRLKYVRIRLWRLFSRRPYVVVVGLGWIGGELLQDLSRSNKYKVVAIDKEDVNLRRWSLKSPHVICLQADATSREVLERIDVGRADKIYVVCDSDETNCWIIDQIASLRDEAQQDIPKCYVHILDARKRFHVSRLRGSFEGRLNVDCFNVYDTTARRLYSGHANYRFKDLRDVQPKGIRVVIMGYTPMGKAILLQCLRAGHFLKSQPQEIVVVTENALEAKVDFEAEFPFFSPNSLTNGSELKDVVEYVFSSDAVKFVDLPKSDSQLLEKDFAIARGLDTTHPMSLYVCLDDGLQSAAYGRIIAEKLQNQLLESGLGASSITYRLFLYYNIPQERQVERMGSLRSLLNREYDPVMWCPFGDLLENCSAEIIEAEGLDLQAKRINAMFARSSDPEADVDEEAEWKSLPEEMRESNRQAADHIAVKLRCFGLDPGSVTEKFQERPDLPKFQEPWRALVDLALRVELAERTQSKGPDFEAAKKKYCTELGSTEFAEFSDKLADHICELAEMEHRRWCAEKLLDGWLPLESKEDRHKWRDLSSGDFRKRKKGQKLHGVLVPFSKLSDEDLAKNFDQVAAIPWVLAAKKRTVKPATRAWFRRPKKLDEIHDAPLRAGGADGVPSQ